MEELRYGYSALKYRAYCIVCGRQMTRVYRDDQVVRYTCPTCRWHFTIDTTGKGVILWEL